MDRLIYRFFLLLCLVFTIYTLLIWRTEGNLDILLLIFLFFTIVLILFVMMERKKSYQIMKKQKEEITMYQLYTKPMEDLVREIRAKQHEFDNHMNAILHMHLAISDYDLLVKEQSKYIKEIYDDRSRQYYSLLCISDKVLAGFLYSKIVSAPEGITIDLHVEQNEIFSKASEHDMIEVAGTLIDNAIEDCVIERKRMEAERMETDQAKAGQTEAGKVKAERMEAERIETGRTKAERIEAERIETGKIKAEWKEAKRMNAKQMEDGRMKMDRIKIESAEIELGRDGYSEREKRCIKMEIGSQNDKMIFAIWNEHTPLSIEEMSHFFEKGYSTKGGGVRNRGLGLYNAKNITKKCHGSLTVGMEQMDGKEYICFRVEM